MIIKKTKLNGCFEIYPSTYIDKRGFFFESYNAREFSRLTGQEVDFVQDNQSYSRGGVIRGLHYQYGEFAQAKLVQVMHGTALDVVVDIRKESSTFGQHIAVKLSGENKKQLFIPRGFAHGFSVLSHEVIFSYKCDNYYNNDSERGIRYNDTDLNINWRITKEKAIISQKDSLLPLFKNSLLLDDI